MSVTEEGLEEYIEIFNRTLRETAEQHLTSEGQRKLFHLSLLPARIIGYVSTQWGVALEYFPQADADLDTTDIVIIRGCNRVEDLLVMAPLYLRNTGPMIDISGSNTRIQGMSLEGMFPFRLSTRRASVSLDNINFRAGSWHRHITYAEVFGDHAAAIWSREKAISRAKDEVLVALSELNRAERRNISITDFITNYKEKTVLLLGDYNTGLERLQTISDALEVLGYDPVLVRDVPDVFAHDLGQKVVLMGAVSRFVFIDDSSSSGHLNEIEICRNNRWVTALLRAGGRGGSWMTAGASVSSKVILEKDYDPENPGPAVSEAVRWAEERLIELQRSYDNTYPWR